MALAAGAASTMRAVGCYHNRVSGHLHCNEENRGELGVNRNDMVSCVITLRHSKTVVLFCF